MSKLRRLRRKRWRGNTVNHAGGGTTLGTNGLAGSGGGGGGSTIFGTNGLAINGAIGTNGLAIFGAVSSNGLAIFGAVGTNGLTNGLAIFGEDCRSFGIFFGGPAGGDSFYVYLSFII